MSTQSKWIEAASPANGIGTSASWFGQVGSRLVAEVQLRADQLVDVQQTVFLTFLFVIAWVVRMTALLGLRHLGDLPGRQEGADGIEFEQLARALAQGRGYVRPNGVPTAFRAPGFPIFASIIYRATHLSVGAATLSFPILGAAVCVVTYLLAREVVSERAARLAAILSVVYFPAIYFSTVWVSEPLFMCSFGLSSWLFLRYLRIASRVALVFAGLLFSWSVLVRPFAILMLPALLILDLMHSRRRLLTVPLMTVCCLLPTSFWAARNYRLYHAFVLGTTNGGSTFYGGNNDIVLRSPQHFGAWVSTVHLPGRSLIDAAPNEYLHDQVEWQLGKQWVKSHLTAMPLLVSMKLIRFVLPDFESENKKYVILSVCTYLPFIPLLVFGVRAAAAKRNRTVAWLLVHLAIASTIVTGMIFWGNPRFRDSAAPMLLIYAGFGLDFLIIRRDNCDTVELSVAAD